MSDRDAILAAILADPADDTARLVLADLLRESELPDDRARGRFLWAGVTAARHRDDRLIDDPLYYGAQREIEAVASAGYPARWLSALGVGPQPLGERDWAWDSNLDRVTVRVGEARGAFTRGLLSHLAVTLAECDAVVPPALAAWPLEEVAASDVPGLSLDIVRTVSGWRLEARLRLPRRRVPLGGGTIPAAVAPAPFLTEEPAVWRAQELFPDRPALVASFSSARAHLIADLQDAAGDRWPRPPRRRA
jgi:uncharacterized protein (TIGR02996 family)